MANDTAQNNKDILKKVSDLKKRLQDFRFGTTGSKTRNTKEGKNDRKEIARLLTALNSNKNQ